tara:strand:- start:378 stop:1352 length:975 start_codon:yes stop_codon:yes gene_type:complete
MAVFTRINNRDILNIENQFNIGKIQRYKGIKKGIENTNYFITIKNKKYILTIFEKRVNSRDLPYFMNLMSRLSKLKVKCPNPVKSKKGKFIFKIKNKNACIVSFLIGKDKKELNYKDCYMVGKNVAKLHLASKKIKLYRRNSLSISSWSNLLSKISIKIDKLSKNLKSVMKNELIQIKKAWPKNMPKGIIHSDLFVDNIIFHKKKFHGFIDFYFSCNDYLSYELATCINALCFEKKGSKYILNKKKSSNLIRGYESIRKLKNIERKNFNTMCRGSALRYLLTRAYDYLNTPKNAIIKIKDPREYIQKLNFHHQINSYKAYKNND